MLKTLSRLLISAIFINGGANAFMNPGSRPAKVEAAGIPKGQQAVILNGLIMVVAGSALAMGIFPKLSAAILAASLVPTTYVGHAFWQEENPGNRAQQQIHFLKNVSMLGGLLYIVFE